MLKVKMFDMAGKEVGDKVLPEAIFGVEPNVAVMHEVVKNYLANQRQGTQSTKTRTEVSGGGRKPWRQKGTGHARQGSTRSPQWTHGGIALGPKPRDYRYTLNKKVRVLGLKSALSSKVKDKEIVVVDAINLNEYKTKTVANMLKALKVEGKALIVTDVVNEKLVASAGNIAGVKTTIVGSINTYDVLNAGACVLTSAAVDKLEEVYAK